MEKILTNLIVELRRGTQILFVLNALKEKQYGYSLLDQLEKDHVAIEAGTLYPLLRRLDEQNLLISEWDTTESRPRKYYQLSKEGLLVLDTLKQEWLNLQNEMSLLFKENSHE